MSGRASSTPHAADAQTPRSLPRGGSLWRRHSSRVPYLLLLLATLAGAALLSSPTFVVARPDVVGQSLVDGDAIARASGVTGRSVFLIDRDQVERAVLDLRPIASARATISWPNVVIISVVERQPAAVWRSGGESYLVCADGVVLGESHGATAPLTIGDLDGRRVFVGGQVDRAVIARASALRAGLTTYQPKGAVFDYSRAEGLSASLELPGPPTRSARVAFGQDGDVAVTLEVWRRLAAEMAGGKLKAEFVDLRIADRPFVR